jgi:hypothetical protein
MNFLIDYNLQGQAALLWGAIAAEGWLELMPIRVVGFEEVGLLENRSWPARKQQRSFSVAGGSSQSDDYPNRKPQYEGR